jgi:hypothetical protein
MLMGFERMFRLVTWPLALLLGCFALATMFAEISKTSPALADWATASVLFRGDLLADLAAARAAAITEPPNKSSLSEARTAALAEARQALRSSPHLSRTWLLIAKLESLGTTKSLVSDALKMSYLTAPADTDLIPDRLRILSASTSLNDSEDLKGMARGDIRLILTRQPDLKPAIIEAYRQGSPVSKKYIEDVVISIEPAFAASLRP